MKDRRIISFAIVLCVMVCIMSGCGKSKDAASELSSDEGFNKLQLLLNDRDLNSNEVKAICDEINDIDTEEYELDTDGKYSNLIVYGEYGSGSNLSSAMISEMILQACVTGAPHNINGVVQLNEINAIRGECVCNHRSGSADMIDLGSDIDGHICPQCGWVCMD